MSDSRRFKGIGSITPATPLASAVSISASPAPAPHVAVPADPPHMDLFRAALERISRVYSTKTALIAAMRSFSGGFRAAAWRSGNKTTMEQSDIVRVVRKRANHLACSGADVCLVEEAIALWEEAETALMTMLDKLSANSQMRLV